MWIWEAVESVLEGRTAMEDADPAIRSYVRLPIYQKAVEILSIANVRERREILSKAPPLIRPYLEEEIMRVWELRRSTKQDT